MSRTDREEDDIEVQLEPPRAGAPGERSRPDGEEAAVAVVGTGADLEPSLYLDIRAIETMFLDAAAHPEVETGGLLAGDLYRDAQGTYLLVVAALPARGTERSPVSVTFTHEAWADMLARRERDHPDLQVIGWYHTHPRMRVFLSEPDRFIHRSFFARPQDIAVVLDLHKREWGVFRWHNDCIEIAHRFTVYGERPSDGDRIPQVLGQFSMRGD